ncbi:MAG: hypothetical protein II816_08230 [Elusimicrobia bacterium]|nr:hypothetical protein [Elusimicrobiota bacterium]
MKKITTLIAVLILFVSVSFAKEKTFTKEAVEVVPASQSQDQVIAYLTQKLTREATEEAGTFITSELNIKNYEITKDEFTSFAGAISKVKVENKETFTKNNQQYVKVKLNVTVDTDNVKTYLEKIMQDNEYKKEAEELRQKNLELEKQLKTATKQQYEKELSSQVKEQIALQQKQELEIEKLTLKAKEEFAKAKEEQDKKTAEREKEILKLKEQIAKEQNNIKKAELENQARIKELENKAKNELKNYTAKTKSMTFQQAVEETRDLRNKVTEITDNFETLIRNNRDNLIKSYDEQIKLSVDTAPRGEWETAQDYNKRLEKNKEITNKLEIEKSDNIFQYNRKTLNSMITTLESFERKLSDIQNGKYFDKSRKTVKADSFEKVNIDENYFVMNIKYKGEKYAYKYDFSDIGAQKAQLMYKTPKQFLIEPMFSVNNNLKGELTAFLIKHLGTNITKEFVVRENSLEKFDEIKNIEQYKQLDETLAKIELVNETTVQKENLIAVKSADILDKSTFEKLFKEAEKLGRAIVAISVYRNMTVGIQADGDVVSCGNNLEFKNVYQDADLNNWTKGQRVVKIADRGCFFGLRKDGSIVLGPLAKYKLDDMYRRIAEDKKLTAKDVEGILEDIEYIENFTKEKNVVSIAHNEGVLFAYTAGLRKDGTVFIYGTMQDTWPDAYAVDKWKDIVQIENTDSFGTFGVKKDGTFVFALPKDSTMLPACEYAAKNLKNVAKIKRLDNLQWVALKKNGTATAFGYYYFDIKEFNNVTDIDYIEGCKCILGLRKDGTVAVHRDWNYCQCDYIDEIKEWKDIVKVKGGTKFAIGLKKDGTVVFAGEEPHYANKEFSMTISSNIKYWHDVVDIDLSVSDSRYVHVVGLKKDGTMCSLGDSTYGQGNVYDWGK